MIKLFDRQKECIAALGVSSPARFVLYGGAAGGSKSFTGCYWQIKRRLRYAGTRGLIGRSELKNLRLTTLNTFFEVAKLIGLRAEKDYIYNQQLNVIKFWNGSEILLKDLFAYPSDPNFDSLGSLEITDAFIDEASQVTAKAIAIVTSRIRYKLTEFDLEPKILLTCNPAKGHLYNDYYKLWKDGTLPHTRTFIPALPEDNPHLPKSYYEMLSALDEQSRKRLRDGDWDFDESPDKIFEYDDILRCFRNDDLKGEKYLTCDVARMGKDRTVICLWQGLTVLKIYTLRKQRIDEVTAKIKGIQAAEGIKLKNIIADEDGVGGGVVDSMRCVGFMNGSRATKPDRFAHLKAECYFKLAEMIEQGLIVLPTEHRDDIVKELDLIRRKNPNGDGKLTVTGKEEIAKMHGYSPDIADAIMMRMYYELHPNRGKYVYA
jgi:hypothetical protein